MPNMVIESRRTELKLLYDDIDITETISSHIIDFTYDDNGEDYADDLQLTLEDKKSLWSNNWFPEKGAQLIATIIQKNYNSDGKDKVLECGTFIIDSIDFNGPPDVILIKAASVPATSHIRQEDKSRGWEQIKLSEIANDICTKNGFALMYESGVNPFFDRIDQNQESDISFLNRLAKREGLSMKATSKIMVLFDQESYESKASVKKIEKFKYNILSYGFTTNMIDTAYSACEVSYINPSTKELIYYKYEPESANEDGPILKINERVRNREEARRLAMKRLRQKNKSEYEAKFNLVGDVEFAAGITVDVLGFGVFDGKYIVKSVSHDLTGGYTISTSLRRVLEGY